MFVFAPRDVFAVYRGDIEGIFKKSGVKSRVFTYTIDKVKVFDGLWGVPKVAEEAMKFAAQIFAISKNVSVSVEDIATPSPGDYATVKVLKVYPACCVDISECIARCGALLSIEGNAWIISGGAGVIAEITALTNALSKGPHRVFLPEDEGRIAIVHVSGLPDDFTAEDFDVHFPCEGVIYKSKDEENAVWKVSFDSIAYATEAVKHMNYALISKEGADKHEVTAWVSTNQEEVVVELPGIEKGSTAFDVSEFAKECGCEAHRIEVVLDEDGEHANASVFFIGRENAVLAVEKMHEKLNYVNPCIKE